MSTRDSFGVRDVEIGNEIRELEKAAVYALSIGASDEHEGLSNQIADRRADQRLNAAALEEFDRGAAASARERAVQLNVARVAAGKRVDDALDALALELDRYFEVSYGQQSALSDGGLMELVSDARPASHEIIGALAYHTQDGLAGGLELHGIPTGDVRPLADADRALTARIVAECSDV